MYFDFKVPVILVRFERNFSLLHRVSKSAQTLNLMKIRPVGAELFRADGRIDRQTDKYDEANRCF